MIEDLIFKSKVDSFEEFKSNFLNCIEGMGKYSFVNVEQSISNTDWHLSTNFPRPYVTFVEPVMRKHDELLRKELGYRGIGATAYWYQQYEKGDWHSMHVHGNCSFSNVLFVELPNKETATKYRIKDKEYSFDVKEGEIISFPGILNHQSPVNMGGRKTVFVWNSVVN
jgi:hypothetical protein